MASDKRAGSTLVTETFPRTNKVDKRDVDSEGGGVRAPPAPGRGGGGGAAWRGQAARESVIAAIKRPERVLRQSAVGATAVLLSGGSAELAATAAILPDS